MIDGIQDRMLRAAGDEYEEREAEWMTPARHIMATTSSLRMWWIAMAWQIEANREPEIIDLKRTEK